MNTILRNKKSLNSFIAIYVSAVTFVGLKIYTIQSSYPDIKEREKKRSYRKKNEKEQNKNIKNEGRRQKGESFGEGIPYSHTHVYKIFVWRLLISLSLYIDIHKCTCTYKPTHPHRTEVNRGRRFVRGSSKMRASFCTRQYVNRR